MSKYECKVCGNSFELLKENWYLSSDKRENAEEDNVTIYDTFDCPVCGCQNVIQERKRKFIIQVPPKGSLSNSVEQETTCGKDNDEDDDEEKPSCYGHYDDGDDLDCGCCTCAESCVKKSNYKPWCFGKFNLHEEVLCRYCRFKDTCKKELEEKSVKAKEQPKCLGSIFDKSSSSECSACSEDNCDFLNFCVEKSKKPTCFGNYEGVRKCYSCKAKIVCKDMTEGWFDL